MTTNKPSSGREGGRSLKTRVKTSNKRTMSSALWLGRQLNDPYVARAKSEGYRSRAAFKLIEIDDQFKLLRPAQRIVALVAAPGGWSQVASQRIEALSGSGKVVAVDLLEMESVPGVDFAVMDFNDETAVPRISAMMGGRADGVMSDMASNATGHKTTDQLRIMGLVELAYEFARGILAPRGFFLAKVLQGGTDGDLLAMLKRDFTVVKHVKPKASRADSSELYVLATGFRATPASPTSAPG